jgi:exodeoxyribonuclease VII small subunit
MAEADRPPPGGDRRDEPSPGDEPSFEAALQRLETLVERLEQGELALEEALASFEQGVALSRRLSEQLSAAERRVERLLQEGGGITTRPLDGDAEESD